MKSRKVVTERRRLGRFKAKDGVVVEFNKPRFFNLLKPRIVKSVQIIDINTEGLAFEYMARKIWTTDFKELSISVSGDAEIIESVPFNVISDHKIANISGSANARRCGVKFGKLTALQRDQITHFIKNYTTYIPRIPGKSVPEITDKSLENDKKKVGEAYFVELFRQ